MAVVLLLALGPGVVATHLPSSKAWGVEPCSASVQSSAVLAASPRALITRHSQRSLSWLMEYRSRARGGIGWSDSLVVARKKGSKIECSVCAFSLDATKDQTSHLPRNETMKLLETSFYASEANLKNLVPEKNRVNDINLHNPLLRQHCMGCRWLGVILEWEGVIVNDDAELERKSWTALAEEEGRSPPPMFMLKRAEGMKNKHALQEVLCWSWDCLQVRHMAKRKEELYEEMQGGMYRLLPGSLELIENIKKYDIPIAMHPQGRENILREQ
jgi:hypothetical protein